MKHVIKTGLTLIAFIITVLFACDWAYKYYDISSIWAQDNTNRVHIFVGSRTHELRWIAQWDENGDYHTITTEEYAKMKGNLLHTLKGE